jgi:hypothetical protein
MYWSPEGEITLKGAQAGLFREALGAVADLLCEYPEDDPFEWGVRAFDALQRGQKFHLLARLGRALLREEEPMPRLTASLEGALATVFAHVSEMLELECGGDRDAERVEQSDAFSWRRLVLAAARESGMGELPDERCTDAEEWRGVIEGLDAGLFWDRDYADGEEFLDLDPEEAERRRERLGIAEDYFTDVPPDPEGEALKAAVRDLRELTGCRLAGALEDEEFTGLHDFHHDLLVGPCGEHDAEAESQCPSVHHVVVPGDGMFDCTLDEWRACLRADVMAAASAAPPGIALPGPAELAALVTKATGEGLDDGVRAKPWGGGWVIADGHGDLLDDVEENGWAAERHAEGRPPLVFGSPGEAVGAYLRAAALEAARAARNAAALAKLAALRGRH